MLTEHGCQFYGSVRLYKRYTPPVAQRDGCFSCELPSATDPTANQILYINIGETNVISGMKLPKVYAHMS